MHVKMKFNMKKYKVMGMGKDAKKCTWSYKMGNDMIDNTWGGKERLGCYCKPQTTTAITTTNTTLNISHAHFNHAISKGTFLSNVLMKLTYTLRRTESATYLALTKE